MGDFNPLPPHGGRHIDLVDGDPAIIISIHSFRMEGDILAEWLFQNVIIFQSTPSAWRETSYFSVRFHISSKFQSTPSAWRETTIPENNLVSVVISIHSLRMEGDIVISPPRCAACHFNPLPPHGGRLTKVRSFILDWKFQSTPSAWRETLIYPLAFGYGFISIHSLRMEGDIQVLACNWEIQFISIHSLRMEGDNSRKSMIPV